MLPNTVAPFEQVKVMSGLQSAAAKAGACHNFSIHWIALMYRDEGDSSKAKAVARMAELAKGKGEANPVLQKVLADVWTRESVEQADKLMLHLRGLKLAKNPGIPYSAYNETEFVNTVTSPKEAGILYSFWFDGKAPGAEGGAHSIAFFRRVKPSKGAMTPTDKTIVFFDPNFGEGECQTDAFKQWVAALKKAYSDKIKHHWLKYLVKA